MIGCSPHKLLSAVSAICPDIQDRVTQKHMAADERTLWWELSACLLSSQVPYPLALSAANAIDRAGLLLVSDAEDILDEQIIHLLVRPLTVNGTPRFYRFPIARARQLAATRQRVTEHAGTLNALLAQFKDPTHARDWLVERAPGLGLKQASMFLRNIGFSYELAILDRHVLRYMDMLGLRSERSYTIRSPRQYQRDEIVLREHALELACPVGILDWAIWIVMRVAHSGERSVA